MMWLGDYTEDHATVACIFTTHSSTGAPVAPNSAFEAADIVIFKNGSATEKTTTNGVTMTSPFNGTTGLHCVVIDTSNDTGDASFWLPGNVYTLALVPDETVDGVVVAKVIGQFGIELSGALRPTTASRKLDVSAGGEAGIDWANIGSPTTAQNLSGTNIDADQVVASVSGAVGSVTGAVGSVTGLTVVHIDAAISTRATQTSVDDLPTNDELATALDDVPTADENAAAVLDVAIAGHLGAGTVGDAIFQAAVHAINIDADWADGGRLDLILDARASQASVDELPTNAELTTALGTADDAVLAAIGTVDTVVDAIKLKTDSLTFSVAGQIDANVQYVNNVAVNGTGAPGDEWGP